VTPERHAERPPASPDAVLRRTDLSRAEKLRVLRQQELDQRLLQVADQEGMTGGEPPRLGGVRDALRSLSRSPDSRFELSTGDVDPPCEYREPAAVRAGVLVALTEQAGHDGALADALVPELLHASFAVLHPELLERESVPDAGADELRFDVDGMARWLAAALDWMTGGEERPERRVGIVAQGTAVAAALDAATRCPARVGALVAVRGRPDLAGAKVQQVAVPTLLLAGGDPLEQEVHRRARAELPDATLERLDGTTGADAIARRAREWLELHLTPFDDDRAAPARPRRDGS